MRAAACLLGAAFGAVCAGVVLGAFTGVDGWALNHLMPWMSTSGNPATLASTLLPFTGGTPGGAIPLDLWVYPASFPASAALVGAVCLLLWRRGSRRPAILWATVWLLANLGELLGKTVVSRPALYRAGHEGGAGFFAHSFPSGHAARGSLVAALVALLWPRARALAGAWIAVTFVLLVVNGFHAPSDVLGGALLAGVLIAAALRLLEAREGARPAPPRRAPPGDSASGCGAR